MDIEVRRSHRRKRSISAFQEGAKLVVVIPGHLTKAQEAEWVAKMSARMATRQKRRRPSDAELAARCRTLSLTYFDGAARPTSVAWSRNQNRRWGSCTISDQSIRVSDRLQGMPSYVLDYVLLHELAHLLHADHGPGFWALLSGYPHLEKAKGFLEGVEHQSRVANTSGIVAENNFDGSIMGESEISGEDFSADYDPPTWEL